LDRHEGELIMAEIPVWMNYFSKFKKPPHVLLHQCNLRRHTHTHKHTHST